MLQEFFWQNDKKMFFHFGFYSVQKKRNLKQTLDNLHMMDSIDHETKITRFDMIRPNSDADIAKKYAFHYLIGQITYWSRQM